MSSLSFSGQQAVTLVIGVGLLGVSGALYLFSDDPSGVLIPALFMGIFGVLMTWISIRDLLSADFGEGGPDTINEPSPGETKAVQKEIRRSSLFRIGFVLFIVGPAMGFVLPLGAVGFFIPPIGGFLLMAIVILRKSQDLYQ